MHSDGGATHSASDGLLLRPRPKYSSPFIVLTAFLVVGGVALGIGLVSAGNIAGIVFWFVGAALAAGLALYYRNAALLANREVVGMRNLFGWQTTCPRDQFKGIEVRGARAPTLCFMRKDGKTAFTVIARWWADDQIEELERYLGLQAAS